MAHVLEKAVDLYTRNLLLMEHKAAGYKKETNTYNSENYVQFKGRYFSDINSTVISLIKPIIDKELGAGTWKIDTANFFDTSVPYRIHTDTGTPDPNCFKTFVFPLRYFTNIEQYDPNFNALYILKQKWRGPAAFFVKGSENVQAEFNQIVTDYSDIEGLESGYDATLVEECSHLDKENFEGLSALAKFPWIPGNVIVFDRHRLHVTADFRRAGIYRKLGLSVFTSRVTDAY